jgi:site-specific recombinase XerD
MILKNYSSKTIKSYLCTVKQFWAFCERRREEVTFSKDNAVETYLLFRFKEQKVSWQTVNGDYSGLRLFYVHILDRKWDLRKLPRPKKQNTLPKVIRPEEVELLIENGACYKHKVFMTLLYSTGLRLGEALRLRVEDVDVAGMRLRVLDGKGHKDRYTLLSPTCLDMLRFYIRAYKPQGGLLFNGKYKGTAWSDKTAQSAIKDARRKAKLPEFVTAHTLRHCFATHLLQSGTDLVTIQKLMGHKHLKTTARYIHLDHEHFTKINNPADRIQAWQKVTKSGQYSESGGNYSSTNSALILPYVVPSTLSPNAELKS